MLIHCQKMPSPAQFSQTTEEWHQLWHEQHLLHISDFQIRPSVMAKPHTTYCTKQTPNRSFQIMHLHRKCKQSSGGRGHSFSDFGSRKRSVWMSGLRKQFIFRCSKPGRKTKQRKKQAGVYSPHWVMRSLQHLGKQNRYATSWSSLSHTNTLRQTGERLLIEKGRAQQRASQVVFETGI